MAEALREPAAAPTLKAMKRPVLALASWLALAAAAVAADDAPPELPADGMQQYLQQRNEQGQKAVDSLVVSPAPPVPPPPLSGGRTGAAAPSGEAPDISAPGVAASPSSLPSGGDSAPASPGASAPRASPRGGPASAAAAAQQSHSAKQQGAMTKARAMAESLKKSADAENLSGTGSGAAADASRPGGAAGGPPDLSNPRTASDLGAAAASGFKSSFEALGMKTARGPGGELVILNARGALATAAELDQLKAQIASDPKALMRYPDFFSRITRDKYRQLKDAYASQSGAPAFKDVALDSRDFDWARSCDAVSGDCNQTVKSKTYVKGQNVPPDDLDAMWAAIDRQSDELIARDAARGSAQAAAANGSLAGRLRGMMTGIAALLTGSSDPGFPVRDEANQPAGRFAGGVVQGAASRAAASDGSPAKTSPSGPIPAPDPTRSTGSIDRRLAAAVLAGIGLALMLALLRRISR